MAWLPPYRKLRISRIKSCAPCLRLFLLVADAMTRRHRAKGGMRFFNEVGAGT